MAKRKITNGLIEEKKCELVNIQEQIVKNVEQYKAIWNKRKNYLEAGEILKAQELEGKYYYLRDKVAEQLDQKRLEIYKEIGLLETETNKLRKKLATDVRILDQKQQELEEIKKEFQMKLASKQQEIKDTEFILEETKERLLVIEG